MRTAANHYLRLFVTIVLLITCISSAGGAPFGLTPSAATPGSPAGSYPLSNFETVNLYNGRLGFALPVLKVGGRGSVNYSITVGVNPWPWAIANEPQDNCDFGRTDLCGSFCTTGSCGFFYRRVAIAHPTIFNFDRAQIDYGPGYLLGDRESTHVANAQNSPIFVASLSRFIFVMPDGTEFELRDKNSNGQVFKWSGQAAPPPAFPRGTEFVTADGTSATFISDTAIQDLRPGSFNPAVSYCNSVNCRYMKASGVLKLADGTKYQIQKGRVTQMTDANGNAITFAYTTVNGNNPDFHSRLISITDPLERTITISYGIVTGNDYDEIQFKGAGGVPRVIRVHRQMQADSLREDYTIKTAAQLFPELFPNPSGEVNDPVISAIELPDSRRYTLQYNSYGEVARVTLPTGGAVEYDHSGGIEGGFASGAFGSPSPEQFPVLEAFIYRRLVQRRVIEGGVVRGITTYSKSDQSGGVAPIWTVPLPYIEVNNYEATSANCLATASCQFLSRERHFFHLSAAQSYSGSIQKSFFEYSRYPTWKEAREFKTQFLRADNTVMKEVEYTWSQPHVTWWAALPNTSTDKEPPNNPRIVVTKTTLPDTNQVSIQTSIDPNDPSGATVGFDQFSNRTDLWESDFGVNQPGPWKRHIKFEFVSDPAYTSHTGAHLRRLLKSKKIYAVAPDLTETQLTAKENVYDEGTLTTYTTVTGWVAPPTSQRGNVTTVRDWRNRSGASPDVLNTWLETKSSYDQLGNAISTTDARSNVSSVQFNDAYSDGQNRNTYARPTKITSAVPEPTAGPEGPHASNTAFEITNVYDFFTGQMTSETDSNGHTTTLSYANDSLDRLKQQIHANSSESIKSQTTFTYCDGDQPTAQCEVPHSLVITRDRTTFNDNAIKTVSLYDGLGRTTETRTYESPTAFITTKQEYDSLDRVKKTFNVFRSSSDPTYGWVTTQYDELSRVKKIETFNGQGTSVGSVLTDYSGNLVLVTDPAGKRRLSATDGLGRLVDMWELTPADSATTTVTFAGQTLTGYLTHHEYDGVDNLTSVTQGAQTRSFVYNSLKHLIEMTNPESGNVKFDYDENGNLAHKKDARNVTTTFTYDNVNRLIKRSYSDGTPTVTSNYDADGINNSRGRLTSITSSAGSYTYHDFDALGRILSATQTVNTANGPQNYSMSYQYNRAGEQIAQTYPSGRTVKVDYDDAGRIAGVKDQESGGYYAGAAATDLTNRMQYFPSGALSAMRLGNNLWEHIELDSKSQVTKIGVGNVNGSSNKLRIDYTYGTLVNNVLDATKDNGNVQSQTITVPSLTAIVQKYEYDDLNRLKRAEEAGSLGWTQQFTYDRFGNRLNIQITLPNQNLPPLPTLNPAAEVENSSNKFKTVNSQSVATGYQYDDSGNLLQEPTTGGKFKKYFYDAENRITQAKLKEGATETVLANYQYDGFGNRVKATVGSATTLYSYNLIGQMVAEFSDSGSTSSGRKYLTADVIGSIRMVTDSLGEPIERRDFLPFGEEIPSAFSNRSSVPAFAANNTRQKFTAKERDAETGLDYFLARYFASWQGRFTSADPYNPVMNSQAEPDPVKAKGSLEQYLSNPQNWNRYVYVRNNPLKYVDPKGEIIILWGSAKEREAALERLHAQFGDERFKQVRTYEINDQKLGQVTVVDFAEFVNEWRFRSVGYPTQEGTYSKVMADIISSSERVEFKIAERFKAYDVLEVPILGTFREETTKTTAAFGGGATLNKNESLTGNVQIYIHPRAEHIAWERLYNHRQKSSDGKPLEFTKEQVEAHEWGHAFHSIKLNEPVEKTHWALEMENIMRQRQGSPQRRTGH